MKLFCNCIVIIIAITFLLLPSDRRRVAAEEVKHTATWHYEGGAEEIDLLIPTPFDNVKAYIAPEYWGNVITADVNGTQVATLVFDLKRAPRTVLNTKNAEFTHDNSIELVIGVLYASDNPADAEALQFYTLMRLTNFEELAKAQHKVGLPVEYVKDLKFELTVDDATGFGLIAIDVPWSVSPFQANAVVVPVSSGEFPAAAGEFYEGRHGPIKVTHSAQLALSPAQGEVIAAADGILAQWMGTANGTGSGFFVDFNPENHILVATVVQPEE